MEIQRNEKVRDSDQYLNIKTILGTKNYGYISQIIICIIGGGGIGSNLIYCLAGCGFRRFRLVEGDIVSLRNVPLASPFQVCDIGKSKATIIKKRLLAKFPEIDIVSYNKWDFQIPLEVIEKSDLVVIGVDSNQARGRINSQCVNMKKPTINLGFYGWEAAFQFILPKQTACWSCLFRPDSHDQKQVELMKAKNQCPQPEPNVPGGVIKSTIDQLIGFASNQILKFFTKHGKICQYYHFDAATDEFELRFLDSNNFLKPDPACPVCQKKEMIDLATII